MVIYERQLSMHKFEILCEFLIKYNIIVARLIRTRQGPQRGAAISYIVFTVRTFSNTALIPKYTFPFEFVLLTPHNACVNLER